jgi:hypothetical protein
VVWSSIEKWSSLAPRVYSGVVRIVSGSTRTVNKNSEALITANKETGVAANAKEAKHMVMSCDEQAGQNHSIMTVHKSSESVEQVKYLGTTLTNQNSIQEEIKCRLKSGNTCYHSVQNLLSLC